MNKLRNQYLYRLRGTISGQQQKRIPTNPQHFYQLAIQCENEPSITKIYGFKNQASNQIWQTLEQKSQVGQSYTFYCQNSRGYYRLVEWEKQKPNDPEPKTKVCQYQARGCQKVATYQHVLKLGVVSIDKQWVCGNCKQILENKDYDRK